MTCDPWHELLIAQLDHEIEPEDRARLDAHLRRCASCREDLAELETTSAALRRWEPAEPPHELVFVRRGGQGLIPRLAGWGRSVFLPAGLGAAAAAAVLLMVPGRASDPEVRELESEVAALRDRLATVELSATASATKLAASERAVPVAAEPQERAPAAVADLAPETRRWLLGAVDNLVRESESRQDAKLVVTADQLARSLALQRREDLSAMDRRLRDVQAETFEALVSTHERLDQMTFPAAGNPARPGDRLEPR
jgi:hypothetical protein